MLRLVIVERNAEDILHRHLYRASAIRGVAALALTGLKERICSLFNFQRPVLALGFKVRESRLCLLFVNSTEQTQDIDPILNQSWATVYDAGPTLFQHWVNASCLLGIQAICILSKCS